MRIEIILTSVIATSIDSTLCEQRGKIQGRSVIPASNKEITLIVPGFRVVKEESGFVGESDEMLELVVVRSDGGEGRFVLDPTDQDIMILVYELNDKEHYFVSTKLLADVE